jgi:secernin
MAHTFRAPLPRVACDSLVALGNATADGAVLFAKNSDRPANECQPLVQVPRRAHAAGTRVRCTYIDIAQVAETARVIGSKPYWCWGFEHGLNEHGVAIGNHSVFSKDPLAATGLIGMDLVRLGLERGRTAEQAVDTITALIEAHGQGGSGYADTEWPYHNSFLVADGHAGFILETSDRRWAVRQIDDVGSVSNHLSIGADWVALSDGAIEHAMAAGWWNEQRDERFDFAAAYRDFRVAPEAVSAGRHRRTCTFLEENKGNITADTLKRILRDHYGSSAPPRDRTPADPHHFSVCMHAEPVGTTTASMIARVPPTFGEPLGEPLTYWASLGSACIGVFIPLYVDADLPEVLSRGDARPAADSPWWQFKRLLTLVERDWEPAVLQARTAFDQLEADLAARICDRHIATQPAPARTAFMQAIVDEVLTRVGALIEALERQP